MEFAGKNHLDTVAGHIDRGKESEAYPWERLQAGCGAERAVRTRGEESVLEKYQVDDSPFFADRETTSRGRIKKKKKKKKEKKTAKCRRGW